MIYNKSIHLRRSCWWCHSRILALTQKKFVTYYETEEISRKNCNSISRLNRCSITWGIAVYTKALLTSEMNACSKNKVERVSSRD